MKIVKVDSRQLDYRLYLDQIVPAFQKKFGVGHVTSRGDTDLKIQLIFSSHIQSRGRAWKYRRFIRLNAGTNRLDFEHVALHELAHLLPDAQAHNAEFYKGLKKIIKWAGFDMAYAINREGRYKPRNSQTLMKGR